MTQIKSSLPAVIRENGDKEWYIDGLLHREDGPAIEKSDGTKMWYKLGKIHRDEKGYKDEIVSGLEKEKDGLSSPETIEKEVDGLFTYKPPEKTKHLNNFFETNYLGIPKKNSQCVYKKYCNISDKNATLKEKDTCSFLTTFHPVFKYSVNICKNCGNKAKCTYFEFEDGRSGCFECYENKNGEWIPRTDSVVEEFTHSVKEIINGIEKDN